MAADRARIGKPAPAAVRGEIREGLGGLRRLGGGDGKQGVRHSDCEDLKKLLGAEIHGLVGMMTGQMEAINATFTIFRPRISPVFHPHPGRCGGFELEGKNIV
jgi:hypothetical protein